MKKLLIQGRNWTIDEMIYALIRAHLTAKTDVWETNDGVFVGKHDGQGYLWGSVEVLIDELT